MTILYQLLHSKAMDIYSVLEKPDQFSEIVDVRSPSEFQDDHIPGAIIYLCFQMKSVASLEHFTNKTHLKEKIRC